MSSFNNLPAAQATAGTEAMFSQVEKVVMGLSPVFAVAAGWVSTVVARYFPGAEIPRSQLIWAFVVGVSAVVVVVLKFVHSKDKRLGAASGIASAEHFVQGEIAKLPDGLVYEDELRKLLADHRVQIDADITDAVARVEKGVESRLPTSVAQSLVNVLGQVNLGDLLGGKVDPAQLVVKAPPGTQVTTGSGSAVGGAAGQTAS